MALHQDGLCHRCLCNSNYIVITSRIFAFLLDISCIKRKVTYSIVDYFIDTVSKVWSSVRTRVTNFWAKSWQRICFSRISPSKRVDLHVPWSCWYEPTIHHLFASCTWKSSNKWRECWINYLSHGYRKGSSMPLLVHYNLWYVQVDCPPNWAQWWTLPILHVFVCLSPPPPHFGIYIRTQSCLEFVHNLFVCSKGPQNPTPPSIWTFKY